MESKSNWHTFQYITGLDKMLPKTVSLLWLTHCAGGHSKGNLFKRIDYTGLKEHTCSSVIQSHLSWRNTYFSSLFVSSTEKPRYTSQLSHCVVFDNLAEHSLQQNEVQIFNSESNYIVAYKEKGKFSITWSLLIRTGCLLKRYSV